MAFVHALLASAFLPSPVKVQGAGALSTKELMAAERCGQCHADIVRQWKSSAHRFSSFNNPFYAAAAHQLRRERGKRPSRFCAGCHDPVLLLGGRFDRLDERSAAAKAGVTCLVCHRVAAIPDTTGNGNYRVSPAEPSFKTLRPPDGRSPHGESLLRPVMRTAEFCGSCHKVSLLPEISGDRWRRGQNDYDAWHQSAVSGHTARAVRPAEKLRRCQDCHMPLVPASDDSAAKGGRVRSHRFVGANTALPFLRGDRRMLERTEAFLRDGKMRVDVFALRKGGRVFAPLDREWPELTPGEIVEIDVVVRNRGVGHAFPGGTNDSNDAWLDVRLFQDDRVVARDESHRLSTVLLDGRARPVRHRNVQDLRAVAYGHAVPSGSARLSRYRFRVPEGNGPLRLEAALRWRKFRTDFSRFVCRERPEDFENGCPDLPVTVVASDSVVIGGERAPSARRADADRFLDWGVALLAGLSENVAEARLAFRRAGRPVDEARVEIRLGRLDRALALLASPPPSDRVRLVRARALLGAWRFAEAAAEARAVVEAIPLEREGWRLLASALGPLGKHEEAVRAADRALAIDPEWAEVHLLRYRALQALGRPKAARPSLDAYLRHRLDESEAILRERYLRRGGRRQDEDLMVHVHDLKEGFR